MPEEPAQDRVTPPESIGEEEPMPWEDHDEPENEEEQRNSVLFTQEQLEVLLKMGRPDFGELVAALKTGAAKGERFQPTKPGNFDGARDRKVVVLGLWRWTTTCMPPKLDGTPPWNLPNLT